MKLQALLQLVGHVGNTYIHRSDSSLVVSEEVFVPSGAVAP
jgi:hypothetical protein